MDYIDESNHEESNLSPNHVVYLILEFFDQWVLPFKVSDRCRKCAKNFDIRFYLVNSLVWYQMVNFRHLSDTLEGRTH